jgi:hypothetical protein
MGCLLVWKCLYLKFYSVVPPPPGIEIGPNSLRILPLGRLGENQSGGVSVAGDCDAHSCPVDSVAVRRVVDPQVRFADCAPICVGARLDDFDAVSSAVLTPYDTVGPSLPPKLYGRSVSGRVLPMTLDEALESAPSRYSLAFC